jgi:dCTP deaminase
MLLSDTKIQEAISTGLFSLEPFESRSLQPASYDLRVGKYAFTSSLREKMDVSQKGILRIEPGEFAVVETLETLKFGNQIAAQLGLRSEFARQGLMMLSGPQIDPGFNGVLIVRLINMAPTTIVLTYGTPFLTTQFFDLQYPVSKPYCGPYQNQTGLNARDIQELTQTEGLTLGAVIKTLSAIAKDVNALTNEVATLRGSVSRLTWFIPLIIGFGIAVIAIISAIR